MLQICYNTIRGLNMYMYKKLLTIAIIVIGIIFIFLSSVSDVFTVLGLLFVGFGIFFIYKFKNNKKSKSLNNTEQYDSSLDDNKKEMPLSTNSTSSQKTKEFYNIIEKNKNRSKYTFDINIKEYTNDRIKEIVEEYIENDYYEKDELYEGYSNSDIEDIGDKIYQLNESSFDGNVKSFEDSDTYGVYIKDYFANEIYIGTIFKEDLDKIRNILYYGKNISCSINLSGGKYKIYDDDKFKVITKNEKYVPALSISCEFMNNDDSINENIVLENKENKLYKLYVAKIVGTSFTNEDGEKRLDILKEVKIFDQLKLEQFLYESKKAVKILTYDKKVIGFISANEAEKIYDLITEDKIYKAYYYPVISVSEVLSKRIKILIKK